MLTVIPTFWDTPRSATVIIIRIIPRLLISVPKNPIPPPPSPYNPKPLSTNGSEALYSNFYSSQFIRRNKNNLQKDSLKLS
jgi:hypothetical protein